MVSRASLSSLMTSGSSTVKKPLAKDRAENVVGVRGGEGKLSLRGDMIVVEFEGSGRPSPAVDRVLISSLSSNGYLQIRCTGLIK